jgi:hypothetical protein
MLLMVYRPRKAKLNKAIDALKDATNQAMKGIKDASQKPLPAELIPERQPDAPRTDNLLPFQQLTMSMGWEAQMRQACPIDTIVAAYTLMKAACEMAGLDIEGAFATAHHEAQRGTLTAMMLAHYKQAHGMDYGDGPELAD